MMGFKLIDLLVSNQPPQSKFCVQKCISHRTLGSFIHFGFHFGGEKFCSGRNTKDYPLCNFLGEIFQT